MGTSILASSNRQIFKGLLLGVTIAAIGATLVMKLYPGLLEPSSDLPQALAVNDRPALQATLRNQASLAEPLPVPAPTTPVAAACALDLLVPARGAHDGHALAEHPFPAGPRAKAKVFLRRAQVAAAQGRLRDEELALLAACRENEAASSKPTVPLARVLAKLSERYAAAAAATAESAAPLRDQLVTRSRDMLNLSAQAYANALGPNAPETRQAKQRLARLEQFMVAANDRAQPAAIDIDDHAEALAPRAPRAKLDRSGGPASGHAAVEQVKAKPAPTPPPPGDSPEFLQERQQLESDLDRLRAQAQAVSDDPEGFLRRSALALAERDRCGDERCLRAWYEKRRRDLLAEF